MVAMKPNPGLEEQIVQLKVLLDTLRKAHSYADKLKIYDALPVVRSFLNQPSPILKFIKRLTPECEYAIKSVIALGQGPIIFNSEHMNENIFQRLLQLLEQLLEIEDFYQHLGGIIGYHLKVLELIVCQQKSGSAILENTRYIHPEGLHIGNDSPEVRQAVRWGIENIPHTGVIYPLGGAGDRLNLHDEKTGASLPAALLPFLGFTLLEGLIRELQSRDYLFFKLTGEQTLTPIAIMTSVEKNNHIHILNICKKLHWFGRPSESFYLFIQPVVPVITVEGNWSLSAPLTLTLKPCGHGVLWKLADDQGVLNWFESLGRHFCVIRQINNPVAGTDHSLLALMGIGSHENRDFGFLSCERLLNSDEGTDVLIETQKGQEYEYCLTNIEYTDFTKRGIGEHPSSPGSPYSMYPTNTNILFANISAIRKSLKICPIPGQLVNMKHKVSYINPHGQQQWMLGGRLESTMQNIADYMVDRFGRKLNKEEYRTALRTFIIYNKRAKTISTTKKTFAPSESPYGTPERTYYDTLSNHEELFRRCHFILPKWSGFEDFLEHGPACIILFHPALGPLYSVIEQKIRHGQMAPGSELQLEIAEIDIENLNLDGSLLIEALSPMGSLGTNGILKYGREGRCSLKQLTVRNKGIDKKAIQNYWKNELMRQECVRIILHDGAEFHAEGITLEGPHVFEVPANHRLVLCPTSNGQWREIITRIDQPTWAWRYSFDKQNRVILQMDKHLKEMSSP